MYLAWLLCTSQVLGNTEHKRNTGCVYLVGDGIEGEHLSATLGNTEYDRNTGYVYLVGHSIEGKQLLSPGQLNS